MVRKVASSQTFIRMSLKKVIVRCEAGFDNFGYFSSIELAG